MKWSREYATGIDRIDEQHAMIFRMAEDFRSALDEGGGERVYGVLLQSLLVYVRSHFGFEEGCMERYRCPVAESNKEAHAKFSEVLAGFQERFSTTGFEHGEARRLVDTVDQWLSDHICHTDVQLRRYVTMP